MSLALWVVCHDVALAMREEERCGEDGFHKTFPRSRDQHEWQRHGCKSPRLQGLLPTQIIGYSRLEVCTLEARTWAHCVVFALIDINTLAPERISRRSVQPCGEWLLFHVSRRLWRAARRTNCLFRCLAPHTSWKGAGGSPESCRARPGNALTPRLEIRATDSADIPHERWLYFDL